MVIKVCITERTNLNENLIQNHPDFEFVINPFEADFVIAQSTVRCPELAKKTIYIAIEPPRTDHRIFCYNNFKEFLLVACHNPIGENEIPFTDNDSPQFYPTRADPYPFRTREDTTFNNCGVFYAGMINQMNDSPDACGGQNITHLRNVLGEYFQKTEPFSKDTKILGIGWGNQVVKVDNWREDKLEQIDNSNCDFVLALENTIYPNYLYEKIWDGFTSDRVTLYLGDPNIEKHIPVDCFIDLRQWYNSDNKEIDVVGLGEYLMNMKQKDYDKILNNARKFRETSVGKFREYMDKFTNKLIDFMLANGK